MLVRCLGRAVERHGAAAVRQLAAGCTSNTAAPANGSTRAASTATAAGTVLPEGDRSQSGLAPLGPADVAAALSAAGISPLDVTHPDIPSAAVIGKTIGLQSARGPVVCIVGANNAVDFRALSALGVKKPRLARREHCLDVFGYPPGCFPPTGFRSAVRTLIDADFADAAATTEGGDAAAIARLALGGGSAEKVLALSRAELLACTHGEVARIGKPKIKTPTSPPLLATGAPPSPPRPPHSIRQRRRAACQVSRDRGVRAGSALASEHRRRHQILRV